MAGMLVGLRVIDLSTVGPATRAARVFADYGASVVKVLRPAGLSEMDPPDSAYGGGRGFLGIRLDLRTDAGRDALRRLATKTDIVLESYRPGVADRMGIGYTTLKVTNPALIYAAISGYGATGPRANWAGHDINYVGFAGLLNCAQGEGPHVLGATIGDGAGGGMHAVIAVLAALFERARTGQGRFLDVSSTDGSLWLTALMVDQEVARDGNARHMALLGGHYACYTTYRGRDGKWLTVGAIEHRFWKALCEALGLARLAPLQLDAARQDELRAALAAVFVTRDRDDWVSELGPKDCCVGPAYGYREVWDDAQFRARGALSFASGGGLEGSQVGALFAGADREAIAPRAVDAVDALFASAGYSESEIAALREKRVLS